MARSTCHLKLTSIPCNKYFTEDCLIVFLVFFCITDFFHTCPSSMAEQQLIKACPMSLVWVNWPLILSQTTRCFWGLLIRFQLQDHFSSAGAWVGGLEPGTLGSSSRFLFLLPRSHFSFLDFVSWSIFHARHRELVTKLLPVLRRKMHPSPGEPHSCEGVSRMGGFLLGWSALEPGLPARVSRLPQGSAPRPSTVGREVGLFQGALSFLLRDGDAVSRQPVVGQWGVRHSVFASSPSSAPLYPRMNGKYLEVGGVCESLCVYQSGPGFSFFSRSLAHFHRFLEEV